MKRSRVKESRYVSIWARLVTKLLFVMIQLSELALDLLGERRKSGTLEEEAYEVETDPEDAGWETIQAEKQSLHPVAHADRESQSIHRTDEFSSNAWQAPRMTSNHLQGETLSQLPSLILQDHR